eukprot:scaffold1296_cov230-Chaetoceros_neogracile.AAC.2
MALQQTRKDLLNLYKKLLRSCATYPSKNRWGIYEAIRTEFRDNKNVDQCAETDKKISVAVKGLTQLQMYDKNTLSGGNEQNPNWQVQLEQNPMPKPDN